MDIQEHINEIKELLEATEKYTSNSEEKKQHVMLIMDKVLAFGNNKNFQHVINLFETGVNKAKEFTRIDARFEKYISAFEKLVKKHKKHSKALEKYIKKEEQRKNDEQVKRIEKELRTKRELVRIKWTLSEKPTEKQREQEKKKEQRLERELTRLEWTLND